MTKVESSESRYVVVTGTAGYGFIYGVRRLKVPISGHGLPAGQRRSPEANPKAVDPRLRESSARPKQKSN